jgi:type III pantothenate kinase
MGGKPTVIATGGLATMIAEVARRIDHIDNLLTLKGLKAIYARNERAVA